MTTTMKTNANRQFIPTVDHAADNDNAAEHENQVINENSSPEYTKIDRISEIW